MAKTYQLLLKIIFSSLFNVLKLIGYPPFTEKSVIARFFFKDDLKQIPKCKHGACKYIHWKALKLKKNESGLSFYNVNTKSPDQMIELGQKLVESKRPGSTIIGYLHSSIESINS